MAQKRHHFPVFYTMRKAKAKKKYENLIYLRDDTFKKNKILLTEL